MGGRGSGNRNHWWRPEKKTTAEDCLQVDANCFARAGAFRAGARLTGLITWPDQRTGTVTASVGFSVDMADPAGPWARLFYTVQPSGELVDCPVRLLITPPYLGGLRHWFACPMPAGSGQCGRRVGKLYLPPGGRQFGCRRCHELTYLSAQEAHRFDRVWRTLAAATGWAPADVRRIMAGRASPIW